MKIADDYLSILRDERKRLLAVLRGTKFSKLDPSISHRQIVPLATYAPWDDDAAFLDVYSKITNHTLVDIYRCYELWQLIAQFRNNEGDILEAGVWKGGTSAILASANHNGKGHIFLADTFKGVVKAGTKDTNYEGGEHADASKEVVETLLSSLEINESAYTFLVGIFPDDFLTFSSMAIKLCHIDVDTFLSAKGVFDFIWPRMVAGGVVVFDDYGIYGCEGVTKFVNELDIHDAVFIYNINGHGLLIKK